MKRGVKHGEMIGLGRRCEGRWGGQLGRIVRRATGRLKYMLLTGPGHWHLSCRIKLSV